MHGQGTWTPNTRSIWPITLCVSRAHLSPNHTGANWSGLEFIIGCRLHAWTLSMVHHPLSPTEPKCPNWAVLEFLINWQLPIESGISFCDSHSPQCSNALAVPAIAACMCAGASNVCGMLVPPFELSQSTGGAVPMLSGWTLKRIYRQLWTHAR